MSERNQVTGMGAVCPLTFFHTSLTSSSPHCQTHTTELANVFFGGDMTDFLVRFVHTLDPNGGQEVHWPAYTAESPQLLLFANGKKSLEIIPDTFRKEANEFLVQLSFEQPD